MSGGPKSESEADREAKARAHVLGKLKRHSRTAALLVPLAILEVAMDSGLTLSYRYLIDDAIVPHDRRALSLVLSVLAAAVLVSITCSVLRDYLGSRLVARSVAEVRSSIFDHIQRMSIGSHARRGAADMLGRFSVDVTALETALVTAVSGVLVPGLGVAVGIGMLFLLLPWRYALLGTIVWPLVVIGPRIIAPRAAKASSGKREADAVLFAKAKETIEGHSAIKAYGVRPMLFESFRTALASAARTGAKVGFLTALVERTTVSGVYVVQLIAVTAGGLVAFSGGISVGALVAFLSVFWNLGWSLVVLSRAAPQLVSCAASMQRIDELLDDETDPIESDAGRRLAPLSRSIELDDVTFGYDVTALAVQSLSMSIRAGEHVAIVGASGSGKSTILGLMLRFYDPVSGTIEFDGIDSREMDVRSLRAQTAIVMQDSFLFDGTIRDNIRVGLPSASNVDIEAAARAADVHDAILALPAGYDTRVGAGGVQLSGGERQRVAIARALIRNPSILLLDEASFALDAVTEANVNETLARARQGRTTINVTHRLSSIVHADRIFVMQAGRVVESGTHDELVARRGVYAGLWRKQNSFAVSEQGGQALVTAERLRDIGLLAPLSDAKLEELTRLFGSVNVRAGQTVVRQGDRNNELYIIVRGSMVVTVAGPDGKPKEVARLRDGEEFGELAFLFDMPRTATVSAVTNAELLTLTRERFYTLLSDSPEVRAEVERIANERRIARSAPISEPKAELPSVPEPEAHAVTEEPSFPVFTPAIKRGS
jgi:ATP-binding cassette subfamily B protein